MKYVFTDDELARIEDAVLSGEIADTTGAPAVIRGVMNGQMSIARFYGGIKFNTHYYTYMPGSDELIRDDVFKRVQRWRKEAAKQAKALAQAKQGALL